MTAPGNARQRNRKRTQEWLEAVAVRLRELFGKPERRKRLPEPLELLIATILSQNTNDVNSHRAFVNLKNRYPDFSKLAGASPREIERLIKVGGIARKKSKTITRVTREITETFPRFDRKSLKRFERDIIITRLTELDGVGYKTASCVSLFSLGDDNAFPVDTHVHRVLNRIGIASEKTPDKTYLAVKDAIPPGKGYEIHINLIKFGRKVCTAQNPGCRECIMYDICRWKEKSRQAERRPGKSDEEKVRFMHLEEV